MKLTDEELIERFGMRRYGEFEEQIYELLLRQKAEIERRSIPRVDKNGVQVREGDIVRYSFADDDGEIINDDFVIDWTDEEGSCGWKCTPLNNLESLFDMFPQEDFSEYITVIGNRYDNPDLLERKAEQKGKG